VVRPVTVPEGSIARPARDLRIHVNLLRVWTPTVTGAVVSGYSPESHSSAPSPRPDTGTGRPQGAQSRSSLTRRLTAGPPVARHQDVYSTVATSQCFVRISRQAAWTDRPMSLNDPIRFLPSHPEAPHA